MIEGMPLNFRTAVSFCIRQAGISGSSGCQDDEVIIDLRVIQTGTILCYASQFIDSFTNAARFLENFTL